MGSHHSCNSRLKFHPPLNRPGFEKNALYCAVRAPHPFSGTSGNNSTYPLYKDIRWLSRETLIK